MNASAMLTRDPRKLAALCELWQSSEREVWVTLEGNSMRPTIPPGSRLCLRCRREEMQVGAILAYRRESALIVHRLIACIDSASPSERRLICQGDSNPEPDPPVPPESVVGVIVAVCKPRLRERIRRLASRALRYGRRPLRYLRSRL
jgi:signal peptidase I